MLSDAFRSLAISDVSLSLSIPSSSVKSLLSFIFLRSSSFSDASTALFFAEFISLSMSSSDRSAISSISGLCSPDRSAVSSVSSFCSPDRSAVSSVSRFCSPDRSAVSSVSRFCSPSISLVPVSVSLWPPFSDIRSVIFSDEALPSFSMADCPLGAESSVFPIVLSRLSR